MYYRFWFAAILKQTVTVELFVLCQ